MGKGCVAANCTNNSDKKKDVSFHVFPRKDKELDRHNEWIRQVKRTRNNWDKPTYLQTFVCSDHFTPDSYEQ